MSNVFFTLHFSLFIYQPMLVTVPEYAHLTSFLQQLPERFAEGELVYEGRNVVRRFVVEGQTLIVKRFKKVNAIQQIIYTFFRPTKAARAFRFARIFRERGINTPREIAYMEQKQKGLFAIGWLVTEEVEGRETHLDLREVKNYDPALAIAVAQQIVKMHRVGILHGDLNLSNFLNTKKADGYHFQMIDINRSKILDGEPSRQQCLKNMMRITHRRDLYEFIVRAYAKERGWNEDETAQEALILLDEFEKKGKRLIK